MSPEVQAGSSMSNPASLDPPQNRRVLPSSPSPFHNVSSQRLLFHPPSPLSSLRTPIPELRHYFVLFWLRSPYFISVCALCVFLPTALHCLKQSPNLMLSFNWSLWMIKTKLCKIPYFKKVFARYGGTMSVISPILDLRQEDHKLKTILGNLVWPCLKQIRRMGM